MQNVNREILTYALEGLKKQRADVEQRIREIGIALGQPTIRGRGRPRKEDSATPHKRSASARKRMAKAQRARRQAERKAA